MVKVSKQKVCSNTKPNILLIKFFNKKGKFVNSATTEIKNGKSNKIKTMSKLKIIRNILRVNLQL